MDSLQVKHGQLCSVEEFSTAVAPAGWGVDFCQLDRGRGGVVMDLVGTSDSLLLRTDLHNRVHQQAVPPPGSVTWAFLSEEQTPFKIGKRSVDTNSVVCVHPELGLDGVNESGFSAYTASFSAERISEIAETIGVACPSLAQESWGIPRCVDSGTITGVRRIIRMICEQARLCDASDNVNLSHLLDSELPLELLTIPASATSVPDNRPSNRSRALQRALEYIQDNPRALFSLEHLCRYSACSLSTLERAFHDHFGVSPKQYLIAFRLNGVRKQLLNPLENRGVGDVATAWGFWHLSKFASDYKRMFGELPSATRMAA
jgi:AraC family ethanolamine operon transcriptional activator